MNERPIRLDSLGGGWNLAESFYSTEGPSTVRHLIACGRSISADRDEFATAIIGAALTEFFAGLRVAEARQQGQRWLSALTEATKDLAQVYEAIGPAWFHGDVSFVGRPSIADATRIGGTRGRHLREDRAEDVTGARSAIAAIRILRRPAGGKDV